MSQIHSSTNPKINSSTSFFKGMHYFSIQKTHFILKEIILNAIEWKEEMGIIFLLVVSFFFFSFIKKNLKKKQKKEKIILKQNSKRLILPKTISDLLYLNHKTKIRLKLSRNISRPRTFVFFY